MTTRRTIIPIAVVAALVATAIAALTLTSGGSPSEPAAAGGNGVDRAFAQDMVPHHRDAVAMATVAEQRASRAELKALAKNIVSAQNREISTLEAIDQRLGRAGITPVKLKTGAGSMSGMSMDDMPSGGADGMLREARPFDRAFIDMMIPHHQGAIVMARDALDRGADPQVRKIARAVVDAQSREITQMNTWRTQWYGAASPAGGIPAS